jgi:hypothetical protein
MVHSVQEMWADVETSGAIIHHWKTLKSLQNEAGSALSFDYHPTMALQLLGIIVSIRGVFKTTHRQLCRTATELRLECPLGRAAAIPWAWTDVGAAK